jgi:pyruvate formate lyase activating enzyme
LKSLPPTPVKTLVEARDMGLSLGLQYVYIGNVPGHEGEHTYCPKDGKVLIKRAGYMILENNLAGGKCKFCGTDIPGVW